MATRVSEDTIEQRTREIGHELFARIGQHNPRVYQADWWHERLMQFLMRHDWLKTQAFRFIDVLPAIGNDPPEIARHLSEYFRERRGKKIPIDPQRAALAELAPRRSHGLAELIPRLLQFRHSRTLRARATAWFAWRASLAMAHRFIAGTNIQEAEQAVTRMRRQKLAFTLDVLGEAALSPREARHYYETYHDLIVELPKRAQSWPIVPQIDQVNGCSIPRINVSVKLTALNPALDPIDPRRAKQDTKDLLRPLLRSAIDAGVHIHIDMEHYAIKDLTLEICRELFIEDEFRDYPHFGVVLQAYLRDGDRDARETIDWACRRGTPIWVRLVKGAYWDTETLHAKSNRWPCPVWQEKWQSDACFERMTRILLDNHEHTHVALASHNVRSLAHGLALKEFLHVPDTAFELQMLYGMGDPIKHAMVAHGQRCRIYTPYGQLLPGMAYLIRRLLENTANESFLRHTVNAETPRAELLRNPSQNQSEGPVEPSSQGTADTDFSDAQARCAMQAAIDTARRKSSHEKKLLIGGESVTVAQAVEAAADVCESWKREPAPRRAEILTKVAQALAAKRNEFAALLVVEAGRPWRAADAEVTRAIELCNHYVAQVPRIGQNDEPHGVAALITPASAALSGPAGFIAAAFATGNTVVLKPASTGALVAANLVELYTQAGAPNGVINLLLGPGEQVVPALVAHPHVALLAFAGSREVGLQVGQLAAPRKTILELGGNNAIIIDSDADLSQAIEGVLDAAFGCAGRRRGATSRCIVLDRVFDHFIERLLEAAAALQPRPADDPGAIVTPMIDKAECESARRAIEQAKSEHTCALQVSAVGGDLFIGPTIFTDVPPDASIAQQEWFAPVLSVIRAHDIDEAISIFNRTTYAPVGGIYSRSPEHIDHAREDCKCDSFQINRSIADAQPAGGVLSDWMRPSQTRPDSTSRTTRSQSDHARL